jgi:hypothetical protein
MCTSSPGAPIPRLARLFALCLKLPSLSLLLSKAASGSSYYYNCSQVTFRCAAYSAGAAMIFDR